MVSDPELPELSSLSSFSECSMSDDILNYVFEVEKEQLLLDDWEEGIIPEIGYYILVTELTMGYRYEPQNDNLGWYPIPYWCRMIITDIENWIENPDYEKGQIILRKLGLYMLFDLERSMQRALEYISH